MDTISVNIRCSSDTIEELREQGLLFETIADALGVGLDDVIEIE